MLKTAITVYALRILSGLCLLALTLVVSNRYGRNELAELAIFLFMFNTLVVAITWGRGIRIIDQKNKHRGTQYLGPTLVQLLINSAIILTGTYFATQGFAIWSIGFIGTIPVALSIVASSNLLAHGHPIRATLIHETTRALIPLTALSVLCITLPHLDFASALGYAYLSLLFSIPVTLLTTINSYPKAIHSLRIGVGAWAREQKTSALIFFTQLLFVFAAQFDRLIIDHLGSATELAIYFSAQTVLAILIMAIQSLVSIYTPRISSVGQSISGSLKDESKRILILSSLVAVASTPAAAAYFWLLTKEIYTPLIIYSAMATTLILGLSFGVGFYALQYHDRKSIFLLLTLIGLTAQIIAIFALYNTIGIYSAVLGFLIYTVLTNGLAFAFWQTRGIKTSPL